MAAGIPDFEFGDFDYDVLANGGFVDYPFAAMNYVASQKPLVCAPGTCGEYSSTSYEVAGLLLAATLLAAFANRSRYPTLVFPPVGKGNGQIQDGKISDAMSVPGNVTSSRFGKGVVLYHQNPSILGWTCGNMVGSARDVASLFYDLLDPGSAHPIVSDDARAEMTRFQTTSQGWYAGHLRYGAGLIQRSTAGSEYISSSYSPGTWGYDIGHVGLTYGFASSQGYMPSLGFAYSVASNIDDSSPSKYLACTLHEIAIEVLGGEIVSLGCSSAGSEHAGSSASFYV